jgi:hypothetical protein
MRLLLRELAEQAVVITDVERATNAREVEIGVRQSYLKGIEAESLTKPLVWFAVPRWARGFTLVAAMIVALIVIQHFGFERGESSTIEVTLESNVLPMVSLSM